MNVLRANPLAWYARRTQTGQTLLDNAGICDNIELTVAMIAREHESVASHSFIIEPFGYRRTVWDIFGSVIIFYQAFAIPYNISFSDKAIEDTSVTWYIVELFIGVFFVIDFILNCLTAYVDRKGRVIRDQRLIVKRYATVAPYWMFLDIGATLPPLILLLTSGGLGEWMALSRTGKAGRLLRYLRFVRALRMLKVLNAGRFMVLFADRDFIGRHQATVIRIVLVCTVGALTIHWTSCLWYVIAGHDIEDTDGLSNWDAYQYSVWWATTMFLTASGPSKPRDTYQMALWNTLGFTSVIVNNMLLGLMLGLLVDLREDASHEKKLKSIGNRFAVHYNLPPQIRSRLFEAIQSLCVQRHRRGEFRDTIEGNLSRDLQKQIYGHIYDKILKWFPPFSTGNDDTMRNLRQRIVSISSLQFYSSQDVIMQEGELATTMICFIDGAARLVSHKFEFCLPIQSPWWLGEKVLFLDDDQLHESRRAASCIACEPCSLLNIPRQAFLDEVFDADLNAWLEEQRQKLKSGEPWGCQICGPADHWFSQCPCAADQARKEFHDSLLRLPTALSVKTAVSPTTMAADTREPEGGGDAQADQQDQEAEAMQSRNTIDEKIDALVQKVDSIEHTLTQRADKIENNLGDRVNILGEQIGNILEILRRLEKGTHVLNQAGQSASSAAVESTTESPEASQQAPANRRKPVTEVAADLLLDGDDLD